MIGLPNGLFDFQEECSNFLVDITSINNTKQVIVVKAPTGAGKTLILIDYIDKYLQYVSADTVFVWLCPGTGDLEEQSRVKMKKHLPGRETKEIKDVLTEGFQAKTTAFINWELITKTGNKAITDTEKKNLYERIAQAQRKNLDFILIIDEEHSNDTRKANDIINSFAAKHIIRVSATARENKLSEYYEIDELRVINSGLITKALYINEDIESGKIYANEHHFLIELADNKRKQIDAAYKDMGKNIRPLVIIQFPNSSTVLIDRVEKKLAEMGYTYENMMVAKWMAESENKINIENVTDLNASPVFLLMKQAISTGWDCPRAKVLIKLRENMDRNFEIQTIGRIRRMPEAIHYEIDILDFCYLYTFDEDYKESVIQNIDGSFIPKRLYLKDKCKTFTLNKQFRDRDYQGLGEREIFNRIYNFLVKKYGFTGDKKNNQVILHSKGYHFGEELLGIAKKGLYYTTASILDPDVGEEIDTRLVIDTHTHGILLLHSIDLLKTIIGLQAQKTKTIVERLFRKNLAVSKKILSLDTKAYYAFVINNIDKLRAEFKEATADSFQMQGMVLTPKTGTFRIPEEELYRYDSTETDVDEFLSNAYKDYTSAMVVDGIRSLPERLFERYCEEQNDIEWVYKNGDTGQQYFSIVYIDGLGKQHLFYADYIVKKKNGDVWIIETKGGETHKQSKNIDKLAPIKFNAFKKYAEQYNLKWGFVRDKNERLKINNTEYTEDLQTEHWRPIKDIF